MAASAAAAGRRSVRRTVMKRKALSGLKKRTGTAKATAKVASAVAPPSPALRGLTALVINLERRVDRWEKVQQSLKRQAPWLKVRRLDAVDGRAAPPPVSEVAKRWSTANLATLFHWYKAVTVPMSPGERGCCASHVAAWRQAARAKGPVAVLEDDAVALRAFSSTVETAIKEAPKGTGLVFLSSKDRGRPVRAGEVLMTPDFIWTTVGYLIWPAGARALLKMLPLDQPVDNFLGWHIREGRVKAFSVRPAAVRQANTWNVGSDVPHSDDVAH